MARARELFYRWNALAPALWRWVKSWASSFYQYHPPFRNRRFWEVQALVLLIAGVHDIVEAGGYIPKLGMLYFVPISLFFVPIVYAALYFGFAGSMSTALWTIIITIPNWVFWHGGLERLGVMFQMSVMIAVAVFVGQRVDRETRARHVAEATGAALKVSETRYRGLFETSPIAILGVSREGKIIDANPAASKLFGENLGDLRSLELARLIGGNSARKLIDSAVTDRWQQGALLSAFRGATEVRLEPTYITIIDSAGNTFVQLILRDVTQEQYREAGLKAYAAYVLRGQEEERQRIARELHDETIQTLTLLCRRLGNIEGRNPPLPPALVSEMEQNQKMAEDIVKGLRDFTRALRPSILDDLGIVPSIRRLLVDSSERTGMKGQLKLAGEERRLPADIEVGFFRIAQEALHNVERHSRASAVTVTLKFAHGEVALEVSDNGIGFNVPLIPGSLLATGHLGLIGMQERAELLGGKLTVRSRPQAGTEVTVTVPAPQSANATLPPQKASGG